MSEIVPLWKENNVDHAVFTFDCGGDNMGDTEWVFYDKANQPLTVSNDLEQALDNDVYHHVTFYVDSDGHYIGENGTVHVSFDEDEDEIIYAKSSQSEFSETSVTDLLLPLSAEQINFINQHIFNMNGSDTDEIAINYKHDFLMTNEDEVIVRELITAIENACKEHHPDSEDGDLEEFFTFTTNNEGEDIEITDNQLVIHMSNNFRVYRDSNY
jgi:hypothetical protein